MATLKTGNKMERITDALSVLTVKVKLNNSRGRTDINADAEDFYCGLLNIVLDKDLRNLNALQMDFPAIDLADRAARLCVQVTSTEGREKVSHTLEKFYEWDMEREFDRLIILVIGEKKNFRKDFPGKGKFTFDPKEDIWDTAKLLGEIETLSDGKKDEVDCYLQKHLNIPASGPAPINLPLYSTAGFVGRTDELRKMAEMLEAGAKPLVIWGLGGMGKTELVSYFGRKYRKGSVYLALYRESFWSTVADSVAFGIPEIKERDLSPEERYALAMERLGQCGENDILIIDNADGPGGSFEEMKRENAFRALCALPMKLIITTRMQVREGIELRPMANGELYKLFTRHALDLSAGEMDALIEAVNAHTMTVDLIARTLDESWEAVRPQDILDAMAKSTLPEQDYPEVYTDHNQDPEQRKIYAHLRTLFNLAPIGADGKQALWCAALLPAGGMDPQLFLKALPEGPAKAIKQLEKQGWVRRENHLLTIHPVVRLVCRTELEPTEENCWEFLWGLWEQYDRKHYDNDRFRQMAALFEQASEILEDRMGIWVGRAGYLWLTLADSGRALQCNLRAVELCEQNQPDSANLATAYNNLSSTYDALGDHKKALECQLKALAIFEEVLPPEHPYLATSYNNVGSTYDDLGDHEKALEYKLKALAIWEKVLPPEHPDLATSYNNVGGTYGALGDHKKALEYKMKGLTIREKVLPPEHPDLATSYNNVGGTYGALGDHKKALEYKLKALAIREKVLPPEHPDLATSYNNVGYTYGELGDHERELEYALKALAIREKVLSPTHPYLALSCNNLAWTYYEMGRYDDALTYMRRAAEIAEQSLPEGHPWRVDYCRWAERMEREARQRRGEA